MKALKYIGLSVLGAILLCAFVFFLDIILNKNINLNYEDMDASDQAMFEQLSALFTDDSELVQKVILARSNGFIFRGATYSFNVDYFQKEFLFGWTQAIFATEILLPDGMNLPSVYRLSMFTPGTYEVFFSETGTLDLDGEEVSFIKYSEDSEFSADGGLLVLTSE